MDVKDFLKNFSNVTDCPNTLPCVFGGSASKSKVEFREIWLECISNQINTCMKHVMEGDESQNARV